MKKSIIIIGLIATVATGYSMRSSLTARVTYEPATTPCSKYSEDFKEIFYKTDDAGIDCNENDDGFVGYSIERWSCYYHNTVDTILEGVLDQNQPSICGPGSDEATDALQTLADKLEPWKSAEGKPDGDKEPVTLSQAPSILQEYLRVYECALYEYGTKLPENTQQTLKEEAKAKAKDNGEPVPSDDNIILKKEDIVLRGFSNNDQITYEISRSRQALRDSLLLLSRGRPSSALGGHLECLQRISLDLRNIMGLAAEAGSCIPKSWNARDVLHDYKDREEE